MRSTDFVRRDTNPKRGLNIDPSTLSCAIMQRWNTYCEENTGTGRNKKCSNHFAELENSIRTFETFAVVASTSASASVRTKTDNNFGAVLEHWREAILIKLDQYTGIKVNVHETSVSVTCQNPDSFDVSISADGDVFQVSFGGWHEHFDAEDDALNCFAFGLSKECRLKVVSRGRMDCSWTVQSQENGNWVDDTTTGLMLIPIWRRAQVRYCQNNIERKN